MSVTQSICSIYSSVYAMISSTSCLKFCRFSIPSWRLSDSPPCCSIPKETVTPKTRITNSTIDFLTLSQKSFISKRSPRVINLKNQLSFSLSTPADWSAASNSSLDIKPSLLVSILSKSSYLAIYNYIN